MLSITNISVKTRVLVAVVLMLSCTLGLGLFSVSRLSAVNLKAAEIRKSWLPAVGLIGAIKGAFEYYRALEGSHLSSPSPESMAEEEKTMASVLVDMDSLCRQYQSLVSPGYEAETFKKSLAIWKNYLETSQKKLLVLSRKNEKAAAGEVYRGESYEGYWRARDLFQDLVVFNVNGGKGATDQGAEIYAASKVFIVVLATLATILSLVAGWVIIATVSRPIQTMTGVMNRLAEHDLETMVGGIERKDEIGAMARAVQVFKDGLIEADRLSAEQAQEHEVKRRRAEAIDRLLEGFEKTATSALRTVSMAAAALDTTASSMSDLARQTSTQANLAAAAAEETSSNVQTVSAATDEITSAIREIGIQVTTSTRIAGEAVDEATRTNETVRGLAEAVQKIGDVVGLITNIASQTNLLALNATIEAARAGEAGKGFAIVAGEVKNLATQTAKATDEISAQIAAIQSATGGAVQAIGGIGTTIARINDIATAIAAATEEQGAVTAEISRNVQQAASATQHVTSNILQVTQAAGDTGTAAGQVKEAAGAMARQAETLRINVEHFLTAIKAT